MGPLRGRAAYTLAVSCPFAAIVFDLDGTLLASHDLIAQTVNRVLAGRGHQPVEAQSVHALTGRPIEAIFGALLPAPFADRLPEYVLAYRELFDREVLPVVEPIPGAREALAAIAGRAPLAVATGRWTSTAQLMLQRCRLDHHFEAILGSDLVEQPKPAPDLLLLTLERLGGIDPTHVLVVGDSGADVGMAQAAGAHACAVTWGAQPRESLLRTEPRWCVDRWSELLDLLG